MPPKRGRGRGRGLKPTQEVLSLASGTQQLGSPISSHTRSQSAKGREDKGLKTTKEVPSVDPTTEELGSQISSHTRSQSAKEREHKDLTTTKEVPSVGSATEQSAKGREHRGLEKTEEVPSVGSAIEELGSQISSHSRSQSEEREHKAENLDETILLFDVKDGIEHIKRGKFKTGYLKGDDLTQTFPAELTLLRCIIATDKENLMPSYVNLHAARDPWIKLRWLRFDTEGVTEEGEGHSRVLHRRIFLKEETIETRVELLRLAIKCFSYLQVIEDPCLKPRLLVKRWLLKGYDEHIITYKTQTLESFRSRTIIPMVRESNLPGLFRYAYSVGEIATMLADLLGPILCHANFNSYAAGFGCSITNMAQALADLDRSIRCDDIHSASDERPFAIPLLAGNQEEVDNVFVEYISAKSTEMDHREFCEKNIGRFVNELFDRVDENKMYIPRPTKSCRGDFVLKYRGCMMATGEGKAQVGDTKSGLSYTSMCASSILNWSEDYTPALAIHISNCRVRVQSITRELGETSQDLEKDCLRVKQRTGLPFDLEPPESVNSAEETDETRFPLPPILYYFKRVVMPPNRNQVKDFIKRKIAEADAIAAKEQEARRKAETERVKTKKRGQPSSPARSFKEEDIVKDTYGDLSDKTQFSMLVIHVKKYDEELQKEWLELPATLRKMLLAVFEAVDVITEVLCQQDAEGTEQNFRDCYGQGVFMRPCRLGAKIQPKSKKVKQQDYLYSNVKRWQEASKPGAKIRGVSSVFREAAEKAIIPPDGWKKMYTPGPTALLSMRTPNTLDIARSDALYGTGAAEETAELYEMPDSALPPIGHQFVGSCRVDERVCDDVERQLAAGVKEMDISRADIRQYKRRKRSSIFPVKRALVYDDAEVVHGQGDVQQTEKELLTVAQEEQGDEDIPGLEDMPPLEGDDDEMPPLDDY